jgi:hypothetical protein
MRFPRELKRGGEGSRAERSTFQNNVRHRWIVAQRDRVSHPTKTLRLFDTRPRLAISFFLLFFFTSFKKYHIQNIFYFFLFFILTIFYYYLNKIKLTTKQVFLLFNINFFYFISHQVINHLKKISFILERRELPNGTTHMLSWKKKNKLNIYSS